MGRVSGKVALISGAARGLGAQFARLLAAEGASVVIGDVLPEEGTALAAEIGDAAAFVPLDVTSPQDWEAAVATAVGRYGGLDVLVNNAGIVNGGPLEDYSIEAWNAIVGVNLTGVFLGMKTAIPELKNSQRAPSIINISSIAGLHGAPGAAGYSATKFGVRGLTRSAAVELAPASIRVNSVHPGRFDTAMTANSRDPAGIPMGRLGEPSELAPLVVFLASDEASYVTGSEFVADGGETTGL